MFSHRWRQDLTRRHDRLTIVARRNLACSTSRFKIAIAYKVCFRLKTLVVGRSD
jgi:hypothetical protein